jgi:hypothetical protein
MKYYRRQVTVKIPSDIPVEQHAAIYAKAAELNAKFAQDAGGKAGCIESAAVAISKSGYGACLIAGAVATDHRKDGTFRRRNQAASKGEPRKMWSGRLPANTHDQLSAIVSSGAHKSQADAIAHAVSILASKP